MEDILSSLKDCIRQRKGEQSGGGGELEPTSTHPSCHCNQGRWDTSGEQALTKDKEAHQQALVAAATLEECIERHSWSTTRTQPEACHCSQSQDQPLRRSWGWSCRHCRAPPEEGHQCQSPPLSLTGPHQWVTFLDPGMTSEEEQVLEQASADPDLGFPPEVRPDLKCFLQEPAIMQEEGRGTNLSQGPPSGRL